MPDPEYRARARLGVGVKDEGYSVRLEHGGNGGLSMRVTQRDWNTVGMEG